MTAPNTVCPCLADVRRLIATPEAFDDVRAAELNEHLAGCANCAAELEADDDRRRGEVVRLIDERRGPAAPAARHPAPDEARLTEVVWLREHGAFAEAFRLLRRLRRGAAGRFLDRCDAEEARLHRELGQFEIAEALFRALLAQPELDAAVKIDCHNNLGWLARKEKHFAAAQAHLDKALSLYEANPSEALLPLEAETLQQGAALGLVRLIHDTLGTPQSAEVLAQSEAWVDRAVAIRQRCDTPERLNLARSMLVKGALAGRRGDLAEAIRLHREGLAIRRLALGNNHADVAEVLAYLGDYLLRAGNEEEAIDAYEEAAGTFEAACAAGSGEATPLTQLRLTVTHQRLASLHAALVASEKPRRAAGRALALALKVERQLEGLIQVLTNRHVGVPSSR